MTQFHFLETSILPNPPIVT